MLKLIKLLVWIIILEGNNMNWELSSYNVFCVYNNIKKIINTEVASSEIADVATVWYENSPDWVIDRMKSIYNDMENHYYTYKELMIFWYYTSLFKKKDMLCFNMHSKIIDTMQLFTKDQLDKDKNTLLLLNKKLKLTKEELFEFNNNGINRIYQLTKTKAISPIFFIKYEKKVLTNRNKYDIFKSDDYKKFEFTLDQLNNKLQGDFYE